MDTGINAAHPHFAALNTVDGTLSKNFSSSDTLDDREGHGTHVAGIIAGMAPTWPEGKPYHAATFEEEQGDTPQLIELASLPLRRGASGQTPEHQGSQ